MMFDLSTLLVTWEQYIEHVVLNLAAHEEVFIPRDHVVHPAQCGFVQSIGLPVCGEVAHWRRPLQKGKEAHAVELQDGFRLHWDNKSFVNDPLGHAIADAPVATAVACGLVYFGLRAIFRRGKKWDKNAQRYRDSKGRFV